MKSSIDENFSASICSGTMSISFIVIGIVYAWKLALVLLSVIPLISICATMMYIVTRKYHDKELKAYEHAGTIAQNCLSSIRTVTAFNLQDRFLEMYKKYLTTVNKITRRKGIMFGIFSSSVGAIFVSLFGVGIIYSINLIQNECTVFSYSNLFVGLFSITQSFPSLASALTIFSKLAEGE